MIGTTYIPPAFRVEDPERLAELVATHPLAALVLGGDEVVNAVHLPFLRFGPPREPDQWRFESHLARANPVAEVLAMDQERPAILIFTGPDAYLTPRWYADGQSTSMPTWNYQAVHVRGRVRRVGEDDPAWLDRHLHDLIATHQARIGAAPFDFTATDLPARQLAAMKAAIVGIELQVARIEGIEKLSQNKSQADRMGVIKGLHGRGDAECSELADLMADLEAGRKD
ncbi:MAG TPA: FMN-binding negative transcriptional regulator [Guyparkeria sp.]|nr:FMN-binding negative transcriptional regulator [Guyparkeria sp.]